MTKTPRRRKTPSPGTNLPPQIPTQVKLTMETAQIRRKMESKLRIHKELLKIKRIFENVSNLLTAL